MTAKPVFQPSAASRRNEERKRVSLITRIKRIIFCRSDGLKNSAILFRMKNTQECHGRQSTGLIKAIKLEGQKTVTANWYTTKRLPETLREVSVRGLMLQHGSASSRKVGLTVEIHRQKQIKVIKHPLYSPDQAICDFWGFFNLIKNIRGSHFQSEEDNDVAINTFFINSRK
ncbi:histone-lysine N-methyltransferase SETMAR [Trichonephila clavipes]|nr:histone-lysine N-methyltransferase SETMAR [Trichonephila clavipes]